MLAHFVYLHPGVSTATSEQLGKPKLKYRGCGGGLLIITSILLYLLDATLSSKRKAAVVPFNWFLCLQKVDTSDVFVMFHF